jgi:Mn-dependent DtxR family transcriptional regulator
MPLKTYFNRVGYIDNLIRTKATGNVKQFAKKLNLSEPSVLKHIRDLKELGCPIKFCRKRNSYYYEDEGRIIISFFEKSSTKEDKLGGGG